MNPRRFRPIAACVAALTMLAFAAPQASARPDPANYAWKCTGRPFADVTPNDCHVTFTGTGGTVNIERESDLSGAIHTKGFYILGGLLRHLLLDDHPLVFDASVAFEQSYGGIDGDSASCAEICCLLSGLTGIPIRQGIAITGAIDQAGNVEAIGGVNEKIEGFFDTCRDMGLTGEQGVVVPKSNAGELMLRADVVEACREGRFHVWAVERVEEAIEVLTGVPAGKVDEEGEYPDDTILGAARQKAREYWLKAIYRPDIQLTSPDEAEEEEPTADN